MNIAGKIQGTIEPLTYEQEVHALLHAAAANTESLLQYFEAQAATEKGDAKKLTQKCIDWKREDLRRIRELIPDALARRDAPRSDLEELATIIYERAFNYAGDERVFWMETAIKVRGAASPAEGPTPDEYVRVVDRNEEPTYVQIRVGEDWYTISKGHESNSAYERVAEVIKKFAAQFTASGPKPGPHCPKCGYFGHEFGFEIDAVVCGKCSATFVADCLADFAQFFTPSAGEPQPHGKETK